MVLPACTFVIFGATGDLTKRKLIPALYALHRQQTLHKSTKIIAIGRRQYTNADIKRELKQFIPDKKQWDAFTKRITYHQLEFDDQDAYKRLKTILSSCDPNRVFYLATPPDAFPVIVQHLSKQGIATSNQKKSWHRVVFEKPFGHDLPSAQKLNTEISKLFSEQQIFRIDHYLGKGLVQDILVLRFSNSVFEHLWDARYIDHVQIVVIEKEGVGTRGAYYEHAGVLRDFVQNHLLQLLALTGMEAPTSLNADDIRDEKVKVLRAIKLYTANELKQNVILGQYASGTVDGKRMTNYRDEPNVDKRSTTETFAAIKLLVHNKRWAGVPFYLRTGKALGHAYAEVVIVFKQAPCTLFCSPSGKLAENKLVIRIQPDEGVKMEFNLQEHGKEYSAKRHSMDFSHKASYGMNSPGAYERLLADVMRGDQTLFTRWDEVAQEWRIVDNLRSAKVPLHLYKAGSHGPAAALELVKRDHRDWAGNDKVKE